MTDQASLPEERFLVLGEKRFDLRFDFFFCPNHGLIVPSEFDSEWNTDMGCPVPTYHEEPCDEQVQAVFLDSLFDATRKQERERLAERLEEVDAGLQELRERREREGKDNSAAYLQGRQHECRNQAAALRGLSTADLRANPLSEAVAAFRSTLEAIVENSSDPSAVEEAKAVLSRHIIESEEGEP